MKKTYLSDPAVTSHGRCDLTGLPCLRAFNLARQMARASVSLDAALPETFCLEAEVEITDCLRICRLSITLSADGIAVFREGRALAAVDLPALCVGEIGAGTSDSRPVAWRGH